jgi:hypothetical protein
MLMHPQTIFDSAELTTLRAARQTTHKALGDNLDTCVKRWRNSPILRWNRAGYAAAARILGDRPEDLTPALTAMRAHFNVGWSTDKDLDQARDLLEGAIGFDILCDRLNMSERSQYRTKIGDCAAAMVTAATQGAWWTTDLVQNHNWVNFAALGVAGQALDGEDVRSQQWLALAQANFQKIKLVHDLVTDGSWHKGIGYLEFGLSRALTYWAWRRSPRK